MPNPEWIKRGLEKLDRIAALQKKLGMTRSTAPQVVPEVILQGSVQQRPVEKDVKGVRVKYNADSMIVSGPDGVHVIEGRPGQPIRPSELSRVHKGLAREANNARRRSAYRTR